MGQVDIYLGGHLCQPPVRRR